jgi:alkylation response protein AidB-like acyl-CoA dehydrogenase
VNFLDSPEEADFRARLRTWLKTNSPLERYPAHGKDGNDAALAWHRTMFEGGWLGLSWPKEYGGHGLSPVYDAIVNEEVGRANAPAVPSVSFLGRAILRYGTPDQQRQFLPPMLRGEIQWCQGFSEPGAGSDLASLRTRAERRDEHYVVNGQKVWTSRAQWADWCLLLCRTQPELPKHKGLSCLVFEMDRAGITVRPVRQIWGSAEFNEVFFDDLEVPVSHRIGEEGDGWALATTVLSHERGPADIGFISKFEHQIAHFDSLLASLEGAEADRLGTRLSEAYIAVSACRLHVLKSLTLRAKGVPPGSETSIDKLLMTRAEQRLGGMVLDTAGAAPLLVDEGDVMYDYFRSRAASIYGGTTQIQKGIVAQRLLGMPRGR